jgi:phage shock protein E
MSTEAVHCVLLAGRKVVVGKARLRGVKGGSGQMRTRVEAFLEMTQIRAWDPAGKSPKASKCKVTKQLSKGRVAMQASELLQQIKSNSAPVIIDPRSEFEFKRGHIPGAINAPVRKILLNKAHLPNERNSSMVIACMHGQRAVIAKWLLALYGYRNTDLLEGYIEGWIKAGLPVEQ